MQRWLAIAWLVWTTNSPLLAEDVTRDPFTSSRLPRVFRSGRPRFLAVPESASKWTIDFKASISSSPDFLNIPTPLSDEDFDVDERESANEARRSSGILRVQHSELTEPILDEQLESTFPPQPSGSIYESQSAKL